MTIVSLEPSRYVMKIVAMRPAEPTSFVALTAKVFKVGRRLGMV